MSETFPLLIRCDSSAQMGVGHVMRCLALAQAWQDQGGKVVMLGRIDASALQARLRLEQVTHQPLQAPLTGGEDAEETIQVARAIGAPWVVLDGYQFGEGFENSLRQAGIKVLTLDDVAERSRFAATAVLNQNAYADPSLYLGKTSGAKLLVGARYTMLRREFVACSNASRETPANASRVLVTMGGGDSENVTLKVLQILAGFTAWPLHIRVLVGAANPNLAALKAEQSEVAPHHLVELLVNPPNVPEIMASCDLAITAAGSSGWELACLGVPMLLVTTADNQRLMAQFMTGRQAAANLGGHDDASREAWLSQISQVLGSEAMRRAMAGAARQLIDGKGAGRVAQFLAKH